MDRAWPSRIVTAFVAIHRPQAWHSQPAEDLGDEPGCCNLEFLPGHQGFIAQDSAQKPSCRGEATKDDRLFYVTALPSARNRQDIPASGSSIVCRDWERRNAAIRERSRSPPLYGREPQSSALKLRLPCVEQEAHLFRMGRTANERTVTPSFSAHSSTRRLNSSLFRHPVIVRSLVSSAR